MLYDIIIRLLSAAGLTIIINANGITTASVVVSICVFLFMEISIIVNAKLYYRLLTLIPFIITVIYISLEAPSNLPIYIFAILIMAGFTGMSLHLYYIAQGMTALN